MKDHTAAQICSFISNLQENRPRGHRRGNTHTHGKSLPSMALPSSSSSKRSVCSSCSDCCLSVSILWRWASLRDWSSAWWWWRRRSSNSWRRDEGGRKRCVGKTVQQGNVWEEQREGKEMGRKRETESGRAKGRENFTWGGIGRKQWEKEDHLRMEGLGCRRRWWSGREKRKQRGRKGNRDVRRDREVLQQHFKSSARAEGETFQSSHTDLSCTQALARERRKIWPSIRLSSQNVLTTQASVPHMFDVSQKLLFRKVFRLSLKGFLTNSTDFQHRAAEFNWKSLHCGV